MGANVLISLKKNGIIVDSLLIDSECPDFIKQQLDTYEPINSLDFEKIGSADLLVIVTGLAGNVCTKYLISIIQYAIKSCKDVVLFSLFVQETYPSITKIYAGINVAQQFVPGLDSIPDLDKIVKDFINHFKKKIILVISLFILYSLAIFIIKLVLSI